MDRLSVFLTLIAGAMFTGGLIAAVLSFGWYSWIAIDGAAAIGFALTRPASHTISRLINRQNQDRDAIKVDWVESVIPDPAVPEV